MPIIHTKVNRFDSNFGVDPNSITLRNNWTTPIDATNIEMSGKDFSRESDFGDGLTGLWDLKRVLGL